MLNPTFVVIFRKIMMNKIYASFSLCLMLSMSACGQRAMDKGSNINALAAGPSTRDFVAEAASSDMFEIQSSQFAAQRSDPQTRAFATSMINDHQRTSAELMSMINSRAVNTQIPATMIESHRAQLDRLQSLSGPDFTRRYREAQVQVHQDAVSLYQRYAAGGDNPTLKSWASRTVPALQHHLAMAQQLNK